MRPSFPTSGPPRPRRVALLPTLPAGCRYKEVTRGCSLGVVLALPAERRHHDVVEVAVEHGLHVPRLVPAAEVFDQLIRRHHVRTDLAPPGVVALRPGE